MYILPLMLKFSCTGIPLSFSCNTLLGCVPAGTQPDSVLQLKNKGMPVHENLSIRGTMYIRIHVTIPKLNEAQLKKIEDL